MLTDHTAVKDSIRQLLFSLFGAPCVSVASKRLLKNSLTESGTGSCCNSQSFGSQLFFSGSVVHCFFMPSLIKEAACSVVVFLLTEWWMVFLKNSLLITTSVIFTFAVTKHNWVGINAPLFFSSTFYAISYLQHSDRKVHVELTMTLLLHPLLYVLWYNSIKVAFLIHWFRSFLHKIEKSYMTRQKIVPSYCANHETSSKIPIRAF